MEELDALFARRLDSARTGDPGAFDDLLGWIEAPLLGFLRARRVSDPHGAANDVLVKVFRNLDGFDGNAAQFRAWVFTIARNTIVDHVRTSGRRPESVTAPEHMPQLAHFDHNDIEAQDRVDAMLAGLTDEQREVMVLRVVVGLSVEETAEVVGRRLGAVRALQHRALNQLRKEIRPTP